MTLQSGKTVRLTDFGGKYVAVYFYPKDETPGCTMEAAQLRDAFEQLKKADVVVIGVSSQDADSHKRFIEKERLPFDLAVDADGAVARAFGVPRILGHHARQTFLIGKDGRVKKAWRKVRPDGHAQEILDAAKG
ncbi:MAG: peroxiredoxin [Polyangiaceae bacterium]|nr:peroxiredoxin [Polyangiaceae bacterium]